MNGFYGQDYDDDGNPVPEVGPHVLHLSEVEPERVSWLWPGYLPLGKLIALDGDPGVGKSTVASDIAARVTTGSPMPDRSEPVKGSVLILSAEDGLADTIRPRLDAAGADPAKVVTVTEIVSRGEDGDLFRRPVSIPGDLGAIERVILEHGVVLVIWDVLMAFLSAEVNSHRDQDVRRALHVLASMAERCGCSVIVLRHLNKAGGGNPIYRGGGSIGIIGAARAGFMCGTDPDDESGQTRVFACVKSNLAAEPPALTYRLVPDEMHGCARVEWHGVSPHKAATLLAEPASADDRSDRAEAADWLVGYLTDHGGEAFRKDIFKDGRAAGFKDATLKRAKDLAKVTHDSIGFPRQTVWALPVGSAREPTEPTGQPTVGSPATRQDDSEPTEPTEPTGADLRKQTPESRQSAQSAQHSGTEPTESSQTDARTLPDGICRVCHQRLDEHLARMRWRHHPACEPDPPCPDCECNECWKARSR